ncbi:MAG: dynamin family protein [Paludibacteraceae bacterium]|nr:dynamin family protein [Paludibacteraceae bacterium]
MKKEIQALLDIASDLGFSNIVDELKRIEEKSTNSKCPLILPLVGEFSSGKTTLINALTDSKKLETATRPTTATIYEVHFGAEKCYANVLTEKGESIHISDIAELKNDKLSDAKVVTVFDTSNRVPSTTVLVDTPGLSSPDPKHKQTLVDFLPYADGILLVSDINQQITKSLTDFISTISLSKRPVYLVLTKSDTKSAQDIQNVKKYISENIHIGLENISCVSANNDDLSQLYELFSKIKTDKAEILQRVNEQRIKIIAKELATKTEDLLNSIEDDKEIDEALRRKKYELEKLHRNIDGLVGNMEMSLSDTERNACRKFEDIIFNKLDSIVANSSSNIDAEAISAINNTSSLIISEYKEDVRDLLRKKARENRGSENEVNLRSLEDVDLSSYSVNGISYNLSLNTLGHEYDGAIANGVIGVGVVAAAVAAAPAVLGAGGAAAAEGAVVAEGAAVVEGAGYSLADFAVDAALYGIGTSGNKEKESETKQENKGIVESMVGFVTERTMAKPQRRRVIHDYVDSKLIPNFNSEVKRISRDLLNVIKLSLHNEAAESISEMTKAIEDLKKARTERRAEFDNKKSKLREYKNVLLTY